MKQFIALSILLSSTTLFGAVSSPVFPPASQTEVNAGTQKNKFVSPATLKAYNLSTPTNGITVEAARSIIGESNAVQVVGTTQISDGAITTNKLSADVQAAIAAGGINTTNLKTGFLSFSNTFSFGTVPIISPTFHLGENIIYINNGASDGSNTNVATAIANILPRSPPWNNAFGTNLWDPRFAITFSPDGVATNLQRTAWNFHEDKLKFVVGDYFPDAAMQTIVPEYVVSVIDLTGMNSSNITWGVADWTNNIVGKKVTINGTNTDKAWATIQSVGGGESIGATTNQSNLQFNTGSSLSTNAHGMSIVTNTIKVLSAGFYKISFSIGFRADDVFSDDYTINLTTNGVAMVPYSFLLTSVGPAAYWQSASITIPSVVEYLAANTAIGFSTASQTPMSATASWVTLSVEEK